MNKEFFNSEFNNSIKEGSWSRIDSGSSRAVDYNEQFALFVKAVPVAEIFKTSAKHKSEKPNVSSKTESPPKTVMEYLRGNGGYCTDVLDDIVLSDSYSSNLYFIDEMKSDVYNLVVCAECFWFNNPSNVISYNFSFVYCGYIFTFIFFVFDDVIKHLSLELMLGRIFDFLEYNRIDRRKVVSYKYISELDKNGKPVVSVSNSYSEAKRNGKYAFINEKATSHLLNSVGSEYKPSAVLKVNSVPDDVKISVILVLYHGLQLLSTLDDNSSILRNFNVRELDKGVFSMNPLCLYASSVVNKGWNYVYPVSLNIRDVVLHDCIGDATPSQFGECARCRHIDFTNTEFGKNFELCLDNYIASYPLNYMNYASQRNTDILMYMSVIWGFNRFIPVTLTSAACKVAKEHISAYLGCKDEAEYLSKYSGTAHFKGKLNISAKEKFGRQSRNAPMNAECDNIHRYSANSYRGGYNGCFSVDAHNGIDTFDLDISGAYPTAMALIPAVNWSDPIACQFSRGQKLSLSDFDVDGTITPFAPVFVSVTYKFPDDCLYPCLPRNGEDDDEVPAYPLQENTPVYCSGPELYVALKLGAEITVVGGYKANVLHDENGEIVYPYRSNVKELVKARSEAEKKHGKKSFEAKLLKLVVNMLYGKTAQQVSKLYHTGNKEKGDESPITNPVSATMITSFVRAVLFSAFHDIKEAGYEVYSATTDGLITNMPYTEFRQLDLFGLNSYLTASRKYLTDEANPETWSVKHEQNDLINLTTRGNASLISENPMLGIKGGVFAKNGVCSAFPDAPKDCAQNRIAFVKAVSSRTGKVPTEYLEYPTIKEIADGDLYTRSRRYKNICMDYDMKRKPIRSSLRAENITVDGKIYEIAHIETKPYRDSEELKLYRSVAKTMRCLRTVADWEEFFSAVDMVNKGCSRLPTSGNYEWAVLCACIIGYRAGKWDIPYLNTPGLTVADKCKWINSFNTDPAHTYSKKQWERASEKAVQAKCLPFEVVKDLLRKMLH